MSKKFLLILGLLVVAGLTLASCGGSAFECDDPLGCVTYEDGDPIRIANCASIMLTTLPAAIAGPSDTTSITGLPVSGARLATTSMSASELRLTRSIIGELSR